MKSMKQNFCLRDLLCPFLKLTKTFKPIDYEE